jgi:hypothetical protein
MSNSKRSGLVALALGPILAITLSACVVVPAHRPYPGGAVTVDYGEYYYYPNAQVYYSISTGYYFYLSGGVWLRTRILPRRYYLNPRYRVRVRAPRHRPYDRFREHQRRYPNPHEGRDDRNRRQRPGTDRNDWNRGQRPGSNGGDWNRGDRGDRFKNGPGVRQPNTQIRLRPPQREPVRNGHPELRRKFERLQNRQNNKNGNKGRTRGEKKSKKKDNSNDKKDEQQIHLQ